ncbi:MAG: hypothetical protein IJF33_05520, partial [Clostridia bacterium]|nr:hypothetical protein [Clostridia bacterium]
MKKFLLILLTLATLMTVLASCSEGDPQETDTESNSTESSKESGSGGVVGPPSILDGVTFPGKVLNILMENRGNVVEYVEKVDAKTDVLDKALYDRVDRAETRLQLRTR